MKIVYTGPPATEVAIHGLGVVKPGDVVDAPEELAQNLIAEGRATVPSKPKPAKQEVKIDTKVEE